MAKEDIEEKELIGRSGAVGYRSEGRQPKGVTRKTILREAELAPEELFQKVANANQKEMRGTRPIKKLGGPAAGL